MPRRFRGTQVQGGCAKLRACDKLVLGGNAGLQGRPSATTVYTIVNNNDAQFGTYVCIDACGHGNTCIWQNAWLWQCNGTNPSHHYWVWEPDSLIIRSATTDTFIQNPEICLDMCLDTRYGNGACAMTASEGVLNVGFKECTGAPNQASISFKALKTLKAC